MRKCDELLEHSSRKVAIDSYYGLTLATGLPPIVKLKANVMAAQNCLEEGDYAGAEDYKTEAEIAFIRCRVKLDSGVSRGETQHITAIIRKMLDAMSSVLKKVDGRSVENDDGHLRECRHGSARLYDEEDNESSSYYSDEDEMVDDTDDEAFGGEQDINRRSLNQSDDRQAHAAPRSFNNTNYSHNMRQANTLYADGQRDIALAMYASLA